MTDSIYDLAVMGAGVMGLSAAFIAANSRPRDRIVIFDRETVGSGASGFAPGIQMNIGSNEKERSLLNRGSKIWREIYPHGCPSGRDCDVLWLTRDPEELTRMSCVVGTAPSTSFALRERLLSLPQFLIPGDMVVALARGSYCPVNSIVRDLAQRLKAVGTSIRERTSIARIRQRPSHISLQTSVDSELSARRAVLAIGPWLPESPFRSLFS